MTKNHTHAQPIAQKIADTMSDRDVIYIHGRPYPAPDNPKEEEQNESPFPWDLWDE